MEMKQKLFELEADAEIAEMESRKAFEQQEIQLQIEEAKRSFCAPSICPSLISLAFDEDKNKDIKSWLEQNDENFAKGFSQPKESRRGMENKGGSSRLPQKNPKYSNQKSQYLLSQPQGRGTSKSPQRKITGITFPKTHASLQQGNEESKPKFEFVKPSFKVKKSISFFYPSNTCRATCKFCSNKVTQVEII